MIFEILQIRQKAKRASRDPHEFVKQEAIGALIGALIGPFIFLVLFLGFLFILAYTHLLGGPYGLARFFFWFLVIVYGTVGYLGYQMIALVKRAFKNQQQMMREASEDGGVYREAEVVDK